MTNENTPPKPMTGDTMTSDPIARPEPGADPRPAATMAPGTPAAGTRTVEETTNEARQGTTTDGTARRVLFISLGLALICLVAVVLIYMG